MPVRSALFSHGQPLPPASLDTDHSSLARLRHSPLFRADAVRSIGGEPGRSANRQAFPSSPYPAISHSLLDRQIERISFRVSTNTRRAPPCGLSDARAFTSYRIGKEHPHDPDILSVRQDCQTLAGFSGKGGRKRDGSGGRKRDGSDIAKSGGFSACPHSIADLSRFPLSDLSRFPLWPAGMAEGNRETFGPRVGLSSHGSPAKGGPKSKCLARVKIAPTSARLPNLTISYLSRFPLPGARAGLQEGRRHECPPARGV